MLLLLAVFVFGLSGCQEKYPESTETEQNERKVRARQVLGNDSLELRISNDNYSIIYTVAEYNDDLYSTFTVYSSSDSVNSLFEIDYFIDFEEEHWVLKQADSVSQKATDLQINTTSQVISEIIMMLEEGINYTYKDISDNKKYNVANSIFYTRSVLLASQREDCACLPVPLFITSKSVFYCQEDIFYEVDNLIATIDTIVAQGTPLDSATTNLYAFLESTQETTIRYDDYNSFYISKVDFQGMIEAL
ncbi:MAG: hypothetical protein JJT94_12560, partial [Bernardetiaceae bacterium]|nr:hypothetical protein [Bernardetiaceae bacterium]